MICFLIRDRKKAVVEVFSCAAYGNELSRRLSVLLAKRSGMAVGSEVQEKVGVLFSLR